MRLRAAVIKRAFTLRVPILAGSAIGLTVAGTMFASANPTVWKLSWPETDF